MENYKEMYLLLFNAVTDALRQMEDADCASARETLITAQQAAEGIYMRGE